MIEIKRTVNEAIDKLIHPVTGFKHKKGSGNNRQFYNKDKRSVFNKEYRLKKKLEKYNKND